MAATNASACCDGWAKVPSERSPRGQPPPAHHQRLPLLTFSLHLLSLTTVCVASHAPRRCVGRSLARYSQYRDRLQGFEPATSPFNNQPGYRSAVPMLSWGFILSRAFPLPTRVALAHRLPLRPWPAVPKNREPDPEVSLGGKIGWSRRSETAGPLEVCALLS
jgi:hypothetical protein